VSRRRSSPRSESKGTPAWLVSFTDMITLLLSFFILLQAFATTQDPELFRRGKGGFNRAIQGFGIPDWLWGKQEAPRRSFTQRKHPVENAPENPAPERIIDAEDERIRRVFEQLRRLQRIETEDYHGPPARLLATPIRFPPGEATLSAAARAYLADFAGDLAAGGGAAPHLYVIGLAPDVPDPARRWTLSARRAAVVGECLQACLPKASRTRGTRVDSWGGGGDCTAFGLPLSSTQPTYIILAMMQPSAP